MGGNDEPDGVVYPSPRKRRPWGFARSVREGVTRDGGRAQELASVNVDRGGVLARARNRKSARANTHDKDRQVGAAPP